MKPGVHEFTRSCYAVALWASAQRSGRAPDRDLCGARSNQSWVVRSPNGRARDKRSRTCDGEPDFSFDLGVLPGRTPAPELKFCIDNVTIEFL